VKRVLALLVSLSLATAVLLPPVSAAGGAPAHPAATRPASKAVGVSSPSPKAGLPAALTAPKRSANASPRLAAAPEARADADPPLIDPLADAVPGELLVVLGEDAVATTSKRALEARGATVERVPGDDDSLLVRTPRGVNDPVFTELVAQTPGVAWVQPNYIYRTTYTPTDSYYPQQWGLPKIGAPAAWEVTLGRSTVVVAVIDTGVDASHPDLVDRVDTANDWDFVNSDAVANDDNGHGTHVSGIVAATENNGVGSVGVAPRCAILPIKVLSANGSGSSDDVAAGIRYAANHGAKVINLSLAATVDDAVMGSAIVYAQDMGCVVVAAVGNEGSSGGADYPARYAGVIGVAAIDRNNTRASFSNFGAGVDIAAPGKDVLSTVPGGGYEAWDGTSMASPFVAGVAALVLSVNPTWGADQVIARVFATAQDIGSLGDDLYFGNGLVRADGAVNSPGVSADDEIPGVPLTPSPLHGSLNVTTDPDDVYSVYLGEGQALEVSLTGDPGTDFDLYFYGPDATGVEDTASIVAFQDGVGYPESLTYAAPVTGWYYLDVYAYEGAGAYDLEWQRTGSSDDNLPGLAIPSSPATGTLDRAGDIVDVYRVDLEADQLLSVFMAGPAGADYDVWLYGPGATSIDVDPPIMRRESPYESELLRYVATEPGTYSIAVYAYSGAGEYRLEWSRDPHDPDDNIPGVPLPPTASATVGGLSDTDDVYKLYLQAGQTVEATLTETSEGNTDPQLYVYDPTSTDVDVDPWVAEAISSEPVKALSYKAQATGYHYVDVYSGGEPGTYVLEWSATENPDDNIPGLPASSAQLRGWLGVTTDTDDVFRIHAVSGQRIVASLTGVPSVDTTSTDFDLYLFGPGATDARIDSPLVRADAAKYPKTIGFTAAQTGDYYLLAHSFAGEGTYTLDWSAKPFAKVTTPYAAPSVRPRRSFTIYGFVSPRHTSGTYLADVRFYKRDSRGVYLYHHSVKARRYYESTSRTKYKVTTSLTQTGRWRMRAVHEDAAHATSYSAYRYIWVR